MYSTVSVQLYANLLNKLDRSWMTCAIIFVSYEAKFIALSNRLMSKNSDIIRQDKQVFIYLFFNFSSEVTAFF